MNIPYDRALRTAKELKKSNPKKFKDLLEQFDQMSSGSNGGIFFSSDSRVNIRNHYYPEWRDEDFKLILLELKGEK